MTEKNKAAVFIDGGYLASILKKEFRLTSIDYDKFGDRLCQIIDAKRLRTYYYDCRPFEKTKEDKHRVEKYDKFIAQLKQLPRLEVKFGRLQKIGNEYQQKKVDVLMSLDIALMSFKGQIDHAVIVGADSDFVPAINVAKDSGVVTHVFNSKKTQAHESLLYAIDEIHAIDRNLINSSKLRRGRRR